MSRDPKLGLAVLSLAAAGGFAGSADAGVVSLSRIITNTRATAQTYTFDAVITATEHLVNAGVFGSLSVVVTDFNRNGVSITSTSSGDLYSGWIGSNLAQKFVPQVAGTAPGSFLLTALANQQASFSGGFGNNIAPVATGLAMAIGDEIRVRMQFTLSAGDQAAISASFNVLEAVAVPSPASAAVAVGAGWLVRRRRAENR